MNLRLLRLGLTAVLFQGLTGIASAQQGPITIGTASIGSVFYTQAIALSKIVQTHAGIAASVQSVGGAFANMFGLQTKRADVAIGNELAAYDAVHAIAPFKQPIDIRLLAHGQPSLRFIVVHAGSGVHSFPDLVGKPFIGKRPSNRELWPIIEALLKAYGIPESKMHVLTTTNTNETLQAVEAGSVAAAIIPASAGAPEVSRLLREGKITILPIPKDKIEAAAKSLPGAIRPFTLAPGGFETQDAPVNLFAINAALLATASLPDQTAYEITKALFQNGKEFASYHSANRAWTVAHTLDHPTVPLHPGAIRYFKEAGLWTQANDQEQAKLLSTNP
jgi:TRAP transporter TAXI family solute receptor